MEKETIPFLVTLSDKEVEAELKGVGDEMGIFSKFRSDAPIRSRPIPINRLKKDLSNVSETFLSVVKDIKEVGAYKLKEVTLQVEVSANGGVNLIGTANIGGKGAITLKFEK